MSSLLMVWMLVNGYQQIVAIQKFHQQIARCEAYANEHYPSPAYQHACWIISR